MTLTVAGCKGLLHGQAAKDDTVRGLVLRAFPTRKVWYYRYRTKAGKQRAHRLGQFPGLSIEGARRAARLVFEQVAAGRDPGGEMQEKRHQPSMSHLCDLYIRLHLPTKAESSAKLDRSMIERYIRLRLGRMAVADVQQSHVQQLLNDVLCCTIPRAGAARHKPGKQFAPVAANRVRALLSKMFNLATTQPYGPLRKIGDGNPVTGTSVNPEQRRKRLAEPHELAAIARELDRLQPVYPQQIAALWAIWFTGARKNEIARARRDDRKTGHGIFRGDRLVIGRHKTSRKSGEKTIHLPEQVSQLLDELPETQDGSLFGKHCLDYVWCKIRTAAGCTDLTIHDVRRTYLSIAVDGGVELTTVGKLVGHANVETTNGYVYLLQQRQRDLAQGVANRVESWMRPQLPAPDSQAENPHDQHAGADAQQEAGT